MRPFTLRTTDASGGATVSDVFIPDLHSTPFNIGFGVAVTGTVSYTVQHTFDDVFAATFNPATAVWFNHASVAAATANADGNYAYPVRGIRLRQNSGSGSCILKGAQAGRTG
jgi:hypothetical protein